MPFDISSIIDARSAEREALYERHVNPQMARVLRGDRIRPAMGAG